MCRTDENISVNLKLHSLKVTRISRGGKNKPCLSVFVNGELLNVFRHLAAILSLKFDSHSLLSNLSAC